MTSLKSWIPQVKAIYPLTIETVKDQKLTNIPSHMHSQQMNPSLSMKLRKGGKDMGRQIKQKSESMMTPWEDPPHYSKTCSYLLSLSQKTSSPISQIVHKGGLEIPRGISCVQTSLRFNLLTSCPSTTNIFVTAPGFIKGVYEGGLLLRRPNIFPQFITKQKGWVSIHTQHFMTSAHMSAWDPPAFISQKLNIYLKWAQNKITSSSASSPSDSSLSSVKDPDWYFKQTQWNLYFLTSPDLFLEYVCVYIQGCGDPKFPVTAKRAFVFQR